MGGKKMARFYFGPMRGRYQSNFMSTSSVETNVGCVDASRQEKYDGAFIYLLSILRYKVIRKKRFGQYGLFHLIPLKHETLTFAQIW